jgi:hypothetical protein
MDNRKSEFKLINLNTSTMLTEFEPIFLHQEKDIYLTRTQGKKLEYAFKIDGKFQLAAKVQSAYLLKGKTIEQLREYRKLKGYTYDVSGNQIIFGEPLPKFIPLISPTISNPLISSKSPKKRTAEDSFAEDNLISDNSNMGNETTDNNTQAIDNNTQAYFPNNKNIQTIDNNIQVSVLNKPSRPLPANPYLNQNQNVVPDYHDFVQNSVPANPYLNQHPYQNRMQNSVQPISSNYSSSLQQYLDKQKSNEEKTTQKIQEYLKRRNFYPQNYALESQHQPNLVNPYSYPYSLQYPTFTQQFQSEQYFTFTQPSQPQSDEKPGDIEETETNHFNLNTLQSPIQTVQNQARYRSTLFFDRDNESEKQTQLEKIETKKPESPKVEDEYGNILQDIAFELEMENVRNLF